MRRLRRRLRRRLMRRLRRRLMCRFRRRLRLRLRLRLNLGPLLTRDTRRNYVRKRIQEESAAQRKRDNDEVSTAFTTSPFRVQRPLLHEVLYRSTASFCLRVITTYSSGYVSYNESVRKSNNRSIVKMRRCVGTCVVCCVALCCCALCPV